MAELALASHVLKLAWKIFGPRIADNLLKGDPTLDTIRTYLLSEFQKIHQHLDALRRKELAASINYMENGYSLLSIDPHASLEEFKKARNTAHVAVGVVHETADKILAIKVIIISALHEFAEHMETCITLCLKYISRLHSMPEVVNAAECIFGNPTGGKLLHLTGKATRRETLEAVALINKAAWDYFEDKGVIADIKWPTIKIGTMLLHPVYDLILFRPPQIVGFLESIYDGIVAAVNIKDTFYIAGSSTSLLHAVGVLKIGEKSMKYLIGHSGMVLCLHPGAHYLYSGSFDHTIMVWNTESFECVRILRGHEGSVRSICESERFLYSGSVDGKIIVWDLETQEKIETLDTRRPIVQVTTSRNKFLFSMTAPAAIQVWLVSTDEHTFLRSIDVAASTGKMLLADRLLLTFAKEGTDVFSLGSFKVDTKIDLKAQQPVLTSSKNYVIATDEVGNFKQYSISNGKCIFQDSSIKSCCHCFNTDVVWNSGGNMYIICKKDASNNFYILSL